MKMNERILQTDLTSHAFCFEELNRYKMSLILKVKVTDRKDLLSWEYFYFKVVFNGDELVTKNCKKI